MPISDEFVEQLIKDLREENAALTELLLQAGHLMPREESTVVTIPSKPVGLGKMSWYQRKTRLEQLHKPKISELTGIPEISARDAMIEKQEMREEDASQVS